MSGVNSGNPWSALSVARMHETLNNAIKAFLSKLELTDRQVAMVAGRQIAVRRRIDQMAGFSIDRDFLHGSYSRETQIRPPTTLSTLLVGPILDVDAMLVLQTSPSNLQNYWHVNDGGTRLLQGLLGTLRGFQGVTVAMDRPAVTVRWTDLKMEVAPAFNRQGGGLLIPSSDGSVSWQHTDPEADATALTVQNKNCNGELIPMIKMLKCWNRNIGKVYSSFAIETAAFHSSYTGGDWKGLRYELFWFFGKLIAWSGTQLTPPSGNGGRLTLPANPTLTQLLQSHRDSVKFAYDLADAGRHSEAIGMMGKIFGKPFPGVP